MAEPVSLVLATQEAAYALLEQGVEVSLAHVYQHVPDRTQPPIVIIGGIGVSSEGTKAEVLEAHTIEIESFYRGPGRAGLYRIMAAVKAALSDIKPLSDVAVFSSFRFLSESDELLEDGVTYYATQSFEVWVEPRSGA